MVTHIRTERLKEIYVALPKLDCQRKCQESCGPISMSRMEWMRVIKKIGFRPKMKRNSLNCPMLSRQGDCRVYEVRPLICRLWGLVEKMRCPHGCQPERWLTDEEAGLLLKEVSPW